MESGGHGIMDGNRKAAVVGAGLVATGFGLGVIGAALIVPAVFDWTVRQLDRRAARLAGRIETASKTIGSVAGTLQRSFHAAKEAGAAELRRGA